MTHKLTLRLPLILKANEIIPLYYSHSDSPWLQRLLFQLKRWEKAPMSQLKQELNISNLNLPYKKGRFAFDRLLEELMLKPEESEGRPGDNHEFFIIACKVRKDLLQQSSKNSWDRSLFLKQVVSQCNFPHATEEQALQIAETHFKNLTKDAVMQKVEGLGDFNELPRLLNLWLIKKIMARSFLLEIIIKDQCRRLIRQAKFRGLICEVEIMTPPYFKLKVSGPLSLFGPTRIYGRRFVEFIPLLFWNLEFKLRAAFRELGHTYFLHLDSNSPIKVAQQPTFFDSQLEARFYDDFIKMAKDWELIREPEMISINNRIIFPDFVTYNKKCGESMRTQGILIEIIGYWTADYIQKKLSEIPLYKNRKALFIFNEKNKAEILSTIKTDEQYHRIYFYKRKILMGPVLEKLGELSSPKAEC